MISALFRSVGPEVIRYIVSGVTSGVVMYAVGFVLYSLHTPAVLASTVAALASFVVSFVLQRFWVFAGSELSLGTSTLRFVIVTTATWTIGLVWIWLAENLIRMPYAWSQLVLVVLVAALNFTINKFWTFRVSK